MIGEEQGTNHGRALRASVRTLTPSGRKPLKAFEHRSDMLQLTLLKDHSGCYIGKSVKEQGQVQEDHLDH